MSPNLPIKASSRAGRFKKKLVSAEELLQEAPEIEVKMAPILDIFHQGKLSSAEFTALYLITILAHRFPGSWPGAKRALPLESHSMSYSLDGLKDSWEPNVQKRLANCQTLGDLFAHYAFKSTPLTVNRSILKWSTGDYGLVLMSRIPTPAEVLDQQKFGKRCVTVLTEAKKTSKFILGERDALSFTMHDLIHADHFYHDNQCYQGQLGVYGFLDHCLSQGHFEELMSDPKFEAEFEYLIADMNAYPVHLLKCFKSSLIHYHQDGNAFFENWISRLDLSEAESHAWKNLNTSSYQIADDQVLIDSLSRWART